jgi:hypothetical protein
MDEPRRKSLRAALDELATMYAAHIALEEQQVFVLAACTMTATQLREIGLEMKRRRSLVGSGPEAGDAGELRRTATIDRLQ